MATNLPAKLSVITWAQLVLKKIEEDFADSVVRWTQLVLVKIKEGFKEIHSFIQSMYICTGWSAVICPEAWLPTYLHMDIVDP